MIKYINKIDKKLATYIKDVKGFKEILEKHNAYIAGGFLLSAITDNSFETSDIDIYVSAINFDSLFESFSRIEDSDIIKIIDYRHILSTTIRKNTEHKCYNSKEEKKNKLECSFIMASEYDQAFFKKNNIKFKIDFKLKYNNLILKCDIMVINTNTPVLNVINNFDLTCCQLWYNGSEFNGSHLEDIKQKKAQLNKDYIESLLNNNYFIKNRIEKYTKRGFEIKIPTHIYKLKNIDKKSITDIDKFIVKMVINYYMTNRNVLFENPSFRGLLYIEFKTAYKTAKKAEELDLYYIIYRVLIRYCNSFTTYSHMELEMNTYLYLGIDYRDVLTRILKIFNTNLMNVEDRHKKHRFLKIINKIQEIVLKKSDLFLNTLRLFKKYIIKEFKLPFNKKAESIKLDIDFTLEGFDPILMENITIKEHLDTDIDNVCLININDDNSITNVNLTDIKSLSVYFKDMTSGWFYKCNNGTSMASIDIKNAYVKIPGQFTIFVYYSELYDIIKNKYRIVFYKNTGVTINNTVSHDNAYITHFNSRPSFVSGYHCQEGSNITIYKLYKHANISIFMKSSKSSKSSPIDSKKIIKQSKPKATSEPLFKNKRIF